MKRFVHICYGGVGGMAEAVLSLLGAAVQQEETEHLLLFFGKDPVPDRYFKTCDELGVEAVYFSKGSGLDVPTLCKIERWLEEKKPDVVISHMTQAVFPVFCYRKWHRDVRYISVEHHSNSLKGKQDWMLTVLNHWAADHSVYLTNEYQHQVKEKIGNLLRPDHISVIPNGIDMERYCPAETQEQKPDIVIGMQGRLVQSKDYTTLLRSFARVVTEQPTLPLYLEIAGDGPMREELVALSEQLGVRKLVRFLGMVPQDELIVRMQSWSVFVLSTYGETMSRAIMEAQACGLPVVATNVSGVTSAIVDGSNGLLVPLRDEAALAQRLQELLADESRRRELGQNARTHAIANFSATECWRRYEEVIDGLFS